MYFLKVSRIGVKKTNQLKSVQDHGDEAKHLKLPRILDKITPESVQDHGEEDKLPESVQDHGE